MATLVDQLRQLRFDLGQLVEHDPEQEVTGQALPLIDAVVSEARHALPPESTLASHIVEVVSAETIEAGEPLRAADALLIVGQLLAVLADESDERLIAADRTLFHALLQELPSGTGVMLFLRDHDLALPFRWETVAPLDQFTQNWNDAEHRFHHDVLEREREQLLELARSFTTRLALESWPEPGGLQAVVPREHRDSFRLDRRENDIRRVDELNEAATAVYRQHQELVQVARRILAL